MSRLFFTRIPMPHTWLVVLAMVMPFAPAVGVEGPAATAPIVEDLKADPPPVRRALVSDADYQARFDQFLAAEPPRGSSDHDAWQEQAVSFANFNRDYARAEEYARACLTRKESDPEMRSLLSVMLGKQGRYQEALEQIDAALALTGARPNHLNALKASWIHHLGHRDEAKALFASLPIPEPGTPEWSSYHGCRACFSASVHDIPALKESIAIKVRLGGMSAAFVQRDVIFDQYRHLDWFKTIVGDTLVPKL